MQDAITSLVWLLCFLAFCFIQALVINGVFECFRGNCLMDIKGRRTCNGNILFKIAPEFFYRNKDKNWFKPVGGCVKCMSSVVGGLMYWPVVIWQFGFEWWQFPLWAANAFILVTINYYIYKKL